LQLTQNRHLTWERLKIIPKIPNSATWGFQLSGSALAKEHLPFTTLVAEAKEFVQKAQVQAQNFILEAAAMEFQVQANDTYRYMVLMICLLVDLDETVHADIPKNENRNVMLIHRINGILANIRTIPTTNDVDTMAEIKSYFSQFSDEDFDREKEISPNEENHWIATLLKDTLEKFKDQIEFNYIMKEVEKKSTSFNKTTATEATAIVIDNANLLKEITIKSIVTSELQKHKKQLLKELKKGNRGVTPNAPATKKNGKQAQEFVNDEHAETTSASSRRQRKGKSKTKKSTKNKEKKD